MGKWNSRRNILIILGAAAIAVASGVVTHEILEWRGRAADGACFAAPQPECLLDAAERIARTLEGDRRRAQALLSVARGRGRIGDMAGMRRLMEPATEAALADAVVSEPDLSWPDQTLMARIVTGWEEAEDRNRALELANEPVNKVTRDGRREALIGHLARRGDFEGALAVAAGFKDSLTTARLLADILQAGLAKDKAPDLDPMLARIAAIAGGLADKAERLEVRSLIGQLQALAGRTKDALATADGLGHEHRRDWIIQNAVLERVRSGDIEGALGLAGRIAEPSEVVSALWYAVQSLDNPGGRDTAMTLLDRAEAIARTISDPEARKFRLFWIRNSRVKFLDTDDALAIIASVDDAQVRDRMYWTRAGQLAETGDFAKALEVARLANPGSARVFAIRAVAEAAAEVGNEDFARNAFRLANDEAVTSLEFTGPEQHLSFTAESQARLGFVDDARATVELMGDDEIFKLLAAQAIVKALADSGDIAGALEAFEAVPEDYYQRGRILGGIAMARAQTGDLAGAIAMMRENGGDGVGFMLVQLASPEKTETDRKWRPDGIDYSEPSPPPPAKPAGWDDCLADPTDQCILTQVEAVANEKGADIWPLHLLVRASAGWSVLGQMDEAREAMTEADRLAWRYLDELKANPRWDTHGSEETWNTVVRGWANIGGWDQAEALIEALPEEDQGYAAAALSGAYLHAGRLDAAIALADRTADPVWRSDMLYYIAKAQIEHGEEDAARTVMAALKGIIDDNPGAFWQSGGMQKIAELEAMSGRFEDALKIAGGLAETRDRDLLLRDIAKIHAEGGDLAKARETLRGIEDNTIKASGFRQIGVSAAEAGQTESARALFDQALAIVEAMPPGEDRDRMFDHTAWWLAKAGEYDRAIPLPARIEGTLQRAEAYQSLARQMIKAGRPDAAGPLLVKAMESATEILEQRTRDRTIGKSAERWAEAGESATALELANLIEDDDDRGETLGDIAVATARLGDRPSAMQLVERLSLGRAAFALVRIASPDPYEQ